ncbi:MAG TPA: EAL domain-containing protein, partial [Thermoanaerobaculia bacterium]|nr:EAL domain-containing protein [Thermoanaerobaculia bacterium]
MNAEKQILLDALEQALVGRASDLSTPPDTWASSLSTMQQAFVRMAIDHSADGVLIITPPEDGKSPRVLFANRAFCRLSGMSEEEIIGHDVQIFRVEESDRAVHDAMLHPLCQRQPFEGEAIAVRKDQSEYTLNLLLVPIHDEMGEVRLWLAYLRDVSDQKAKLATLEHQALHDALTGLPNRALLLDRLEQSILQARHRGTAAGLMITDLDRFKEINDTFGHHFGDALLQQVGDRLRDVVPDSNTVARMGGDEFAVVLPAISDAGETMRVARRILNALEHPFTVEAQQFDVGISIGIAMFPDHGNDAATLLRRADTAMYSAKREGIGYAVYTQDLDTEDPGLLSLRVELRLAIERNELRTYYQPKVHLSTGLVTRVEALARWQHPEKGLIFPDRFIPLAERTGLIEPLTDWVLDDVLRQCREWQDRGLPLHVAINLSSKSLQEHVLPQRIYSRLQYWGVDPSRLKLEITENSIMSNPPQALALVSLLQSVGVRLSLDDFGTGYSSLVHLRQLPVDEIKIDKSFVMGMRTSEGDAAIVRAMIDLGHNLGRQVVAEGVEDDETCRRLIAMGCDLAQGYCFTPPIPAEALVEWLTENNWGVKVWQRITGR